MFFYKGDMVQNNNSLVDFEELGSKSFNELGSIPIYGFFYKQEPIPLYDKDICGGDCLPFVENFAKMVWN